MDWLIDETRALSTEEAWEAARTDLGFEAGGRRPPIAVVLRHVTIHNTRKLLGPAEIRLDALFVTARSAGQLYHPGTFAFPGVRAHDDLPIDEGGVLLYLGTPRHFLDITLIASRGGSERTLADLLADHAGELGTVFGDITKLTVVAPQAALITGAAAAAAQLGAAALRLLAETTGRSIGLYRVTWFEHRDRYGLGVHPTDGDRFRKGDMEFAYEIFEESRRRGRSPSDE